MVEAEKIIERFGNAKMSALIGKSVWDAKFYFPPTVPGEIIITNKKIVFLSAYTQSKTYTIGFIPITRELGHGQICVEIPICKILEYSVIEKKSKNGIYAIDSRSGVLLAFPIEGDFLNPEYYYDEKTAGSYSKIIFKGKWQLDEYIQKSKWGPIVSAIIDIEKKRRKVLTDLIQNLRKNCLQENLPLILKIGFVKK